MTDHSYLIANIVGKEKKDVRQVKIGTVDDGGKYRSTDRTLLTACEINSVRGILLVGQANGTCLNE